MSKFDELMAMANAAASGGDSSAQKPQYGQDSAKSVQPAQSPTAQPKTAYNPMDDIMHMLEPKAPTQPTKQYVTGNAALDAWRSSVNTLANERKEKEAKAKAEAEQKEYKQLQSQLDRIDANRAYVTTTGQNDALEKERASVVQRMREIDGTKAKPTVGEKVVNAFKGSGSRTTEGFTPEQEEQYTNLLLRLDSVNLSAAFAITTEQSDAIEKERKETLSALHQLDTDAGRVARAYDARDRADAFFKSWGKGTSASYANAAGNVNEISTSARGMERDIADLEQQVARAQENYNAAVRDYGEAGAQMEKNILDDVQRRLDEKKAAYGAADKERAFDAKARATSQKLYDTADKLLTESEQQMAKAKQGTSAVGSFALDAAKTGMDIAADAAASAVGVPGLANMAVRVYGGESQQARLSGDDAETAAAKGMKAAMIEVLTEKISGPFENVYGATLGKVMASTAPGKAVGAAVDKLKASGLIKWAADAAGEGFEEGMSDVLNTVADHIAGWDDGTSTVWNDIKGDKEQILYDMLLGAFVGAFGGASNLANTNAQSNAAPVQQNTQTEAQGAAPAAVSEEARALMESILAGGHVNTTTANTILSTPQLAQAFTEVTGISLTGNTADMRAQISGGAREYAYSQLQTSREESARAKARENLPAEMARQNEQLAALSQEEAARDADWTQRREEMENYGSYDSYVRGIVRNGGSFAEAGEIARTPELRATWEKITGQTLPDSTNKARDMVMNYRADVAMPQRSAQQPQTRANVQEGNLAPTTPVNVKQGGSDELNSALNLNSRDVPAEAQKNTASTQEAGNEDQSVISKMRGAKPQLEQMQSVSSVTGNEIGQNGRIVDRLMNFVDRIGGKVARPGFGDVQITRSKIKSSMIGHGVGNAKIETFAAVPDVIANGQEIDHQANWKGRNYDTYVFAAPVDYRGQKTYVGVVIQKDSASNRYYLHEVLGEDGEVIFKNDTAPAPTPDGTSALSGDLETVVSARAVNRDQANPTSLAPVGDTGAFSPPIADTQQGVSAEDVSSTTSIPTTAQNVKSKNQENAEGTQGRTRSGQLVLEDYEGSPKEKERGFSKNVRTDNAMEPKIRESFDTAPETYKQLANKDTLAKAEDIFAKGLDKARGEVEQALGAAKSGSKLAPEMVPLARMVANELSKNGNVESARRILADVATELTAAGQLGQAGRILRDSDPSTALASIQKSIDAINAEFEKQHKRSKWRAELTEAETQEILSTDFTESGAYERIYEKVATRLGKEMPSSVLEKLTEIRRINMLLRPRTQIKNVASNVPMIGLRKGAETLSIGIQSALTKTGLMDEAKRTRAWASREQRQLAKDYYEANKADINGQSNKWDFKSALREKRTIFKGGAIEKAVSKMTGKEIDSFGEALRQVTYNCLEAGDAPFVKSAFVDSLAQYCAAKGITDSKNITQEAVDFATANAMEATFKNANVIAGLVNRAKRNSPPGVSAAIDVLIPFTTTPANILSLMGDYSPIGFGKMFAKDGVAAKIDAFSKASVGTAMLALGFALRNAGVITGGEDDDKDKAALDKATGQGTYSIGGKVSYDWAQPVGGLLAFGAEIADAVKGQESWDSALMNAIYTAGDATLNLSLFQNIISLLRGSGKPTQQIIDAIMEGGATQLVPGLAGDIAKIIDGTVRSTYTGGNVFADIGAKVLSNTPILSQKLPESVNVKGEANTRGGFSERAVNILLNPTNTTSGKRNAVDEEIYRLYDATGSAVFFPSVSPYKIEYANQTYTMNGEDRETFQKVQGRTYYELARPLLSSEMYKALSDDQKASVLKSIRDYALDAAKRQFVDGRGGEYSNDQWDPIAELTKGQISAYIPAKQALKDGANGNGGRKTFEAIDLLLDGYKKLPGAVQDKINGEKLNVANLLYADSKGIGSKAWYDTHNAIDGTSAVAAASSVSRNFKGSDEEKLDALRTMNSYTTPNKETGKQSSIVRRYEAAMNYGVSFDDWTKLEETIVNMFGSGTPNKSEIYAAAKEALPDIPRYKVYSLYKKDSNNENKVDFYDEYFASLYEPTGGKVDKDFQSMSYEEIMDALRVPGEKVVKAAK